MSAILRELRAISRVTAELGIVVSLPDESAANVWYVRMGGWAECAPALASDMRQAGLPVEVALVVNFPADFPFMPTFCSRVYADLCVPHWAHHGGREHLHRGVLARIRRMSIACS
jgi:hypothetical protein